MYNPILRFSLMILMLVSLVAAATAEELTLELDPAQTEIHFLLEATGHDVHGSFQIEKGEIRFDPETGLASGEIRVDAMHSETGSSSRDKTMHEKVLESDKFGVFLFRPERLDGELADQGTSHIELHGQLEIHGASHPVTLAGDVEVDGDELRGKATFEIPFVEWGMHDPSVLFLRVAKQVEITVELGGKLHHPDAADGDPDDEADFSEEAGQDG